MNPKEFLSILADKDKQKLLFLIGEKPGMISELIIRDPSISRTNAYRKINELEKDGLVSYTMHRLRRKTPIRDHFKIYHSNFQEAHIMIKRGKITGVIGLNLPGE